MRIFNDCCCCSLKTACKILAAMGIIFAIVSAGWAVKDIVEGVDAEFAEKLARGIGVNYDDATAILLIENGLDILLSIISLVSLFTAASSTESTIARKNFSCQL